MSEEWVFTIKVEEQADGQFKAYEPRASSGAEAFGESVYEAIKAYVDTAKDYE